MRKKSFALIGYGIFIITFLVLCIFMNVRIDALITSDDASELILANLLSENGGILSSDWFYSSELRVLNSQIIWSLLFHITQNWHVVRMSGNIILYFILLMSLFFFCRKASLNKWYPYIAALFLLPFSSSYFEFVLKGVYYIPHIIISLLLFGLMFQFAESSKEKKIIFLTLGIFLSIAAGMGGLRQFLIFYLPMLCAVLIYGGMNKKSGISEAKNWLIYIILTGLNAGIGYWINSTVFSRSYYFESHSDIIYIPISIEKIMNVINGWLFVLGYKQGGNIFSADFLANATCGLIVLMMLYSVIHVLRNHKDYNAKEQMVAFFYLSAFVIYILMYSMTSMSYMDRYNIPIIVFGFPLIFICFGKQKEQKWKQLALAGMLLFTAGCGMIVYKDWGTVDNNAARRNVVETLVAKDYCEGYATFWNANVMTELSDGKIQVWTWLDIQDDIEDVDDIYPWLQKRSHADIHPSGKVFILLSTSEDEKFTFKSVLNKDDVIYRTADYVVYGFSSYGNMIKRLSDFSYTFDSNLYLEGGEDIDGTRILHPNGLSYGPYKRVYAGAYEVVIQGEQLEAAEYECLYRNGCETLSIYDILQEKENIRFCFTAEENIQDLEIRVKNNSSQDIKISKITVQKRESEYVPD